MLGQIPHGSDLLYLAACNHGCGALSPVEVDHFRLQKPLELLRNRKSRVQLTAYASSCSQLAMRLNQLASIGTSSQIKQGVKASASALQLTVSLPVQVLEQEVCGLLQPGVYSG